VVLFEVLSDIKSTLTKLYTLFAPTLICVHPCVLFMSAFVRVHAHICIHSHPALFASIPTLFVHTRARLHSCMPTLAFIHTRLCSPVRVIQVSLRCTTLVLLLVLACLFGLTRAGPSCLRTHSFTLTPAIQSRLFSLHLGFVHTCLCPLICVLIDADPQYPVILIWALFGLVHALLGFGGALCMLSSLLLCLHQIYS
jgi:hypothetical protein